MTEKDFIVDALNANVDRFSDPDANAAASRINQTMAKRIQAGDTAKPLTLTQKIFMTQDAVLVAEATLDQLLSDQSMRDFMASLFGEEMVWQSIAHWKTMFAQGHQELIDLKKQLAN